MSRLVDSARRSGEVIQGYDGELRARAYLVSFFTGLRRQELGSLTPRSFRLDDAQPTLVVKAACSKHRRRYTLPMNRVLVSMVRQWVRDLGPDDLLFPRIERKKTWLMVKKDLERVGIPYETPDGIAEFHAAGRHSHIAGLVRSGATIMEATELARHADIRQTVKYTHIGMEDRAEAWQGCHPLSHQQTLIVCTMSSIRAASCVMRYHRMSPTTVSVACPEPSKPRSCRGLRHRLSQTVTS